MARATELPKEREQQVSNETLGDYLARNVGSHVQIALARTKEEPLSIMGGNVIRLEDGRLSIEVDAWPWEQLGEEERGALGAGAMRGG